MPLVQISMLPGRSSEQKRALIAEVTEAVARTCKVVPDHGASSDQRDTRRNTGAVAGVSLAESDAKKKAGG